jgi:hypothetical protein
MNKLFCITLLILLHCTITMGDGTKKAGIYTNMRVHQKTGDVLGMEVFITYSSDGIDDQYYALVQIAEGMPSAPNLVDAKVWGDSVSFSIPTYGLFKGKITQKELRGKFINSKDVDVLKRQKSFWQ